MSLRTHLRLFLLLGLFSLSLVAVPRTNVSAQAVFAAQLNKSFTPTSITAGGISLLTVTIFNPNLFDLANAAWTDNLPAGMIIATPPNVSTTCGGAATGAAGGTVLSLTGGTVPPQVGVTPGQCSVSVNVTSITSGNLVNTLPAGALTSTGNGNAISNTTPASATLTVNAVARPALAKDFTPSNTVFVGQTTNLRIRITNNDTVTTLTNVAITDNLPANVTIAGVPTLTNCGAGTASTTATSVSLSGATITPGPGAGAICTILVAVVSNTAGIYTNTIPANSITTQQGVSNSSAATAPLNVQGTRLTKAFAPTTILAGGTSVLTVTIQNPTGTPFTGANLTDTLPAGVTIANPPNASTTCGAGTVTATAGAGSFSLAGGTVPAGSIAAPGSCTITVTVTAAAGGSYTNRILVNALQTDQGITNVLQATAGLTVNAIGQGSTGSKAFSPTSISPNGVSQLTITLRAPADTALTNLGVTDTLPANVVVASPLTTSTTCTGGTVTATVGGSTVTLSGGSVALNSSCVVRVNVTSATPGAHTNTILANTITNNENRTNASAFSANLTVLSGLTINKAFFPTTVNPNGRSTLTITLNNTNTFPLTDVRVSDTLPSGGGRTVLVANPPNATTTCGGGTVTAAVGTTMITLTGGTIPAQIGAVPGVCTINVDVIGAGPAGSLTNTIPANNVTSNEGITNLSQATANLSIAPLTIGVVKAFNPLTVFGGSASTMTITLINPNTASLSGIAFTDNMPAGMLVAAPLITSTTCTGGVVTAVVGAGSFSFSGGSLAANTSCNVMISVTTVVNGNLTNTIPAGGVTTFNGASNAQPAAASLTNLPGVSVSKSFTPNRIVSGSVTQLQITINNTNPFDLTALVLTDNLPAGLTIGNPAGVVNTCAGTVNAPPGGTAIQLTGGSVVANRTCAIGVNVTGTALNNYTNTLPAGALTSAEGATNTTPASDTLTITILPTVSIAKAFTPKQIAPNGTAQLQITIDNTSAIPLTALAFTDNLPAGLTIATPANVTNTCNGVVTAAPGGTTVQLAGGTAAVGTTCTITMDVTGVTAGNYPNTIPVNGLTSAEGATNAAPASDTLEIAAVGAGGAGAGAVGNAASAGAAGSGAAGVQPSPTLIDLSDPAIVKLGEPQLARPGETVQFTIAVTNRGTGPAVGLVVNDTLPDSLIFVAARSDQGTVTSAGQVVTFTIGTVNPGQTVRLYITARVNPDLTPPLDVCNNAVLERYAKNASSCIRVTRGTLPSTGEHPAATAPFAAWLAGLLAIVLLILSAGYLLHRHQTR
ncbi:MAG: DUF11 domain-containing protein [Anaerolineae bacterium]|nr:DUF11 domain-containing protein [Anaerolineae bacterium]